VTSIASIVSSAVAICQLVSGFALSVERIVYGQDRTLDHARQMTDKPKCKVYRGVLPIVISWMLGLGLLNLACHGRTLVGGEIGLKPVDSPT